MVPIKRYIFLILGFGTLILFQETLFNRFTIFGIGLNLFIIPCFIFIFFNQRNLAYLSAFLAGFILDIFSFFPFGVFIFSLISSIFLIEKIFLIFHQSNVLIFIALFLVYVIFYKLSLFFGRYILEILVR